jgi:type I restriction enzyme R subunit
MIEFKQIIGRGTRLFDGKDYFTIYDFVRAYEHFNDPEWDGEPVEPVPPRPRGEGEEPSPPGGDEGDTQREGGEEEPPARQKIKIKLADGKERTIQHMMATTFWIWSVDGRPMSAAEFITRLFGDLPQLFKDEDELRALWGQSHPQCSSYWFCLNLCGYRKLGDKISHWKHLRKRVQSRDYRTTCFSRMSFSIN